MITKLEKDRLLKTVDLLERFPKSAFAEGWRRTANIFDELEFIYSAVSSGKDSLFMTNMLIQELQRRRMIVEMLDSGDKALIKEAKELLERFSKIRMAGLGSQNKDDIEKFRKWEKMRIAVMQMDYELSFDQTNEVMARFYKEYATDIKNIIPKDREIDEEKSVKENGYDLRWVHENHKYNPYELDKERIENMKPSELAEIYGKALVWGYGLYFPISWQHTGSATDSRYISFDPDMKKLWVNEPPIKYDPHHEWCVTLENMYDSWHGFKPMTEVFPAMTDQQLRVYFSKYITEAVADKKMKGIELWEV